MQSVSAAFKSAVVSGSVAPVRSLLLTLVDNAEVAASLSPTVSSTLDATLTAAAKACNGISTPERRWGWCDAYEALNQGAPTTPENAYRRLVRRDGATRYYRLGERSGSQAWDASGNAQHGTYSGGYTLQQTGLLSGDPDCAVVLNGSTGYWTFPVVNLVNTSFTLEFWINPTSAGFGADTRVFQFDGPANGIEFKLTNAGGGWIGFYGDAYNNIANGTIPFDTPSHIALTYNFSNDTSAWYLNGVSQASGNRGPLAGALTTMYVGRGGAGLYYKGVIDEFAIYPTALSSTQIAAHYAARSVLAVTRCLADGLSYPLDVGYEGGWWGATLADADGNISPAETFTLSYSPSVSIRKITWTADFNLGAPVDFVISYDPNGNGIFTTVATVTDYTAQTYSYDLGALTTVAAIKISISRIMYPYRYTKLLELGGIWQEDISALVIEQSALSERQSDGATIEQSNATANEYSAALRNDDLGYSPSNASSNKKPYLKANRKLDAQVGVRYADNSTEYVSLGRFYSMQWGATLGGLPATVRAQDGTKLLRNRRYTNAPLLQNKTVDQVIRQTLIDAGVGYGNYTLAASSIVIPYAWCPPTTTYFEYLSQLAEAAGGAIYFNETGAFVFEDGATLLNKTGSVFTFTDANALISTNDEYDENMVRNRVAISVNALKVAASASIWNLQETLSLLPGDTKTINVQFSAPALNVNTPSITGGSDIVIQSWAAYGMGGVLVLKNNGTSIETVTAASITGQPLQSDGQNIVEANDFVAQASDGLRDLTISNPYIQTATWAQTIANTLLNIYKNPPSTLTVQAVGLPHLQVGDVVTVNSTLAGISGDFYILRHEFKDDGGWSSTFTVRGVVYATDYPTRASCWTREALVLAGSLSTVASPTQLYGLTTGTSGANGDSFTHSVFLRAGRYTFYVLGVKDADKGKADWYLDGTLFISGQDWYAASPATNVVLSGTVNVPADGYHVLKGVVNGKNASATNYQLLTTKAWFKRSSD